MKSWDEIKQSVHLAREPVTVEQWDGTVMVTELDALTGDTMQRDWKKLGKPDGDSPDFVPSVVAHTVVNEAGKSNCLTRRKT